MCSTFCKSGKDPLAWSITCWLSWFSGPGCWWRPTSRASSRSLKLCPWPSICCHGPSSKFLDLLPPTSPPPVQKRDAQHMFLQHKRTHTEQTEGHTYIDVCTYIYIYIYACCCVQFRGVFFFFHFKRSKMFPFFCSRCNHLKRKKRVFPWWNLYIRTKLALENQTCGLSSNAFKNGALSPRNIGTPFSNASISPVLGPDFCSPQSPETPIFVAFFMLSRLFLKTPQKRAIV